MSEYNYSAQVDIDIAPLVTSLSAAQKELNNLSSAAGGSISSIEEMESTLHDIGGADVLEAIVAGFAKGGQAARKAADDLQFYRDRIEEIRRETAQLASQGTEAGAKATPLQRDEAKASLEEERAVRKAIAEEAKAQAEQEKALIAERGAIFREQGEDRKRVAAEVAAEQKRADEGAATRRRNMEEAERKADEARVARKRADTKAAFEELDKQQKKIKDQEKAAQSYSGNIFQAQVNEIKQMTPALREAEKGTQQYRVAMDQLNKEQEQFVQGLSNARYALFDVSRVMGVVGAAAMGMVTAGVAASSSFERSFAEVHRTVMGTQEEMAELEKQLIGMSTRMPSSFGDIAGVASMGGQLDIATEHLEEFTETVIQFASTTDVSVDRAAESLGRLTQLSGAPQSEISNLGAAIYDVGTNSVATEGAIISIAEEIATAGRLAGFTAEETVGLAGALASLGIQPQAARGSIQRIFQNIGLAVEEGGDELERFAAVSDMAVEQFASAWRDTPQVAFTALIEGLGRVADRGDNVASTLMDIGVTGTRDIQVMASLAANTEVYANTLDTASTAYAENTALAEGYDKIAATLVERITILWNTLKAATAQGFEPFMNALKPALGLLQALVNIFERVASTQIGATLISGAAAMAALVGALALGAAGFARFNASVYGMITGLTGLLRAKETTIGGATRLGLAVRNLSAEFATQYPIVGRLTGGMFGLATATTNAAGATTYAATATRGFTVALRALASTTLIGAGITALLWGINKLTEGFGDASSAMSQFSGASDGLSQAIQRDTAAFREGADAFSTFRVATEESSDALAPWARELEDATGAQVKISDTTSETTSTLREQTMALGENSKAWAANTLANNEDFQKIFQDNADLIRDSAIDLSEVLEAALTSPGEGVKNYFDELIQQARAAQDEIRSAMAVEEYGSDRFFELSEEYQAQQNLIDGYKELRGALVGLDDTVNETTASMEATRAVYAAAGIDIDELDDSLINATESLENFADGLFDTVNATIAMDDALINLHDSIDEHGNSFDIMSDNGVANMQALEQAVNTMVTNTDGDMAAFGTGMAEIFAHVELSAGVLGDEVDFLRIRMLEAFNQTYGIDLDISDARQSIHQFIADAIAAVEARAQLERDYIAAQRTIGDPSRPTFYAEAAESYRGQPSMLPLFDQQIASLKDLQSQLTAAGNEGSRVGNQIRDGFDRAAGRGGGGGAGGAGRAARNAGRDAREAQQELRTLVDYASDLDSVWNRAFDIRFGVSMAKDNSADVLQGIKDRAEEAANAIRDSRTRVRELRAELQTLAADRSIMEYHLSVAVEYGDDLRASQLRAELAKNNSEAAKTTDDLSDEQKELKKAQDAATTSLTGNTEGARKNRNEVQNLIQAYQAEIIALASSGASTDQLNARTAQLRAEFVRQLTQMGYNRSEVNRYARAFDDLRVVINNVPRNITVRANTNPAQQALNEFVARNRNRNIPMRVSTTGLPSSVSGGTYRPTSMAVGSGGTSTPTFRVTGSVTGPGGGGAGGRMLFNHRGGPVPEYHATGGVHGLHPGRPKGTDTTPAWLTPGEFVQRERAVDHYGLPFMNAVNNLKFPRYLATGGGTGGRAGRGGPRIQAVELLPHQMRQLADMVSVNVTLGDRQIAGASNTSNMRDSQRGRN